MRDAMLLVNFTAAKKFVEEHETYNTCTEDARKKEDILSSKHLNILTRDLARLGVQYDFHHKTDWEKLHELVHDERIERIAR